MTKHYAELYDDREEGKVMERVECPSHDLAWEKAHSMLSDWTDCGDGSRPSHIHVRVRDVEVKYIVKAYDDRKPEQILHKIEASTYDMARWEEKRYLNSFEDPDDHVRPLHLCTDIEEVEEVREPEHKKWVDNYEKYQEAASNSTETYTTANGLIAIAR